MTLGQCWYYIYVTEEVGVRETDDKTIRRIAEDDRLVNFSIRFHTCVHAFTCDKAISLMMHFSLPFTLWLTVYCLLEYSIVYFR